MDNDWNDGHWLNFMIVWYEYNIWRLILQLLILHDHIFFRIVFMIFKIIISFINIFEILFMKCWELWFHMNLNVYFMMSYIIIIWKWIVAWVKISIALFWKIVWFIVLRNDVFRYWKIVVNAIIKMIMTLDNKFMSFEFY